VTKLSKGAYRFEITTAPRTDDWFGWWGAPDRGGADVVTSVKAFRGKERLMVPVSGFAGLADAHDFALETTKGGMDLKISGSDAGGSWHGTFRFDKQGLVERTILAGEFPELDHERTTYRHPKDGEID